MPYRGSFGLVMTLHVLTAIFIIGPLGMATLAAPRLLRAARRSGGGGGGEPATATALAGLRTAVRSIRGLTVASVLVVGFGFAIVNQGTFGSIRKVTDLWIIFSIIAWAVAVLVNLVLLDRSLRRAVDVLDAGGDAARFAPVVAAGGVVSSACWVTIAILMVVKPGA